MPTDPTARSDSLQPDEPAPEENAIVPVDDSPDDPLADSVDETGAISVTDDVGWLGDAAIRVSEQTPAVGDQRPANVLPPSVSETVRDGNEHDAPSIPLKLFEPTDANGPTGIASDEAATAVSVPTSLGFPSHQTSPSITNLTEFTSPVQNWMGSGSPGIADFTPPEPDPVVAGLLQDILVGQSPTKSASQAELVSSTPTTPSVIPAAPADPTAPFSGVVAGTTPSGAQLRHAATSIARVDVRTNVSDLEHRVAVAIRGASAELSRVLLQQVASEVQYAMGKYRSQMRNVK